MDSSDASPEQVEPVVKQENQKVKKAVPKWLLVSAPLVLVGIIASFVVLLTPSPEEVYLSKLSEQGLGGIYASDAQAIAAGKAECRRLNDGENPAGTKDKFIAVEVFCDEFAAGYRVLEEIKVVGTMTVMDDKVYGSDDACYIPSSSGFDDMNEGKEVVILNGNGDRLTTANFGPGSGMKYSYCTFEFEFTVLEGEDEYIIEIGRRGSISYSETQLKTPGSVALTLG